MLCSQPLLQGPRDQQDLTAASQAFEKENIVSARCVSQPPSARG